MAVTRRPHRGETAWPGAAMTSEPVFTSRLNGRRLLDAEGMAIGRVQDTVILQPAGAEPPRALGLVVAVQRRRIFVSLGRVTEMSVDGIRLDGSSVDLGHFSQRAGEILASALYDRPAGNGVVLDVGIARSPSGRGWDVSVLAVGQRRGLLRHAATLVPWDKHRDIFDAGGVGEQMAGLRDMHPHDLAGAVEEMPPARRRQLADAMQDEELADLLQEMPEDEQIGFLAGLGTERIADIIEEMEPDDAADLLAEMPPDQREQLLADMQPDRATDLRRLLSYDAATAGGLMTSQPLIVTPDVSVAEVLARMRQPARGVSEAAQAYVCEPPAVPPTGRFLGTVGFQRLLREAPATPVGQCVEESGFVRPALPERSVAARLAAYNLIGIAVCDDVGRLVGAITVDDVLDRLLPANWRRNGL
ncbi:MAG TPA: CBS domain-containing protein [Streptosporangiaceae bacterium]|nr:CBS domain-containing protein [Streptosporangiaceae bacterium]